MMLSEVTPVPDAALPLEAFKAHLRLGTGFGEEELQDSVLIGFLRAALAAIEKRTRKALLQRDFLWQLSQWPRPDVAQVPIAPIAALTALVKVSATGSFSALAVSDFWLEIDSQSPRLHPRGSCLPDLEEGGHVEVTLSAGFAASWDGVPADLAQAVLMLAAHFYEYRNDTGLHGGCMPFGVASLIERYRPLRLSMRTGS